ncbi:hypothetical protein VIGAN_09033400, partial [Vigna angularis var. angularis]
FTHSSKTFIQFFDIFIASVTFFFTVYDTKSSSSLTRRVLPTCCNLKLSLCNSLLSSSASTNTPRSSSTARMNSS